jgi:hypothetical protein
MEKLCHQVSSKAIPIFEALHPNAQAVFFFIALQLTGMSALRAQNVNINPAGKKSWVGDTIIPSYQR